jgi:hypothetical protein
VLRIPGADVLPNRYVHGRIFEPMPPMRSTLTRTIKRSSPGWQLPRPRSSSLALLIYSIASAYGPTSRHTVSACPRHDLATLSGVWRKRSCKSWGICSLLGRPIIDWTLLPSSVTDPEFPTRPRPSGKGVGRLPLHRVQLPGIGGVYATGQLGVPLATTRYHCFSRQPSATAATV